MALAPGLQPLLDATVAEIIADLVGGAGRTTGQTKQLLHIANAEVRDAPMANAAVTAQRLKRRDDNAEIVAAATPVQQIKVEVIGPQACQTCRASLTDPRHRRVIG